MNSKTNIYKSIINFSFNTSLAIIIFSLFISLFIISKEASAKEGLNYFKIGPQCEDGNYQNALVNCHGSEEFITIDDNEICRSAEFLRNLGDETCVGEVGEAEAFVRMQDCSNDNYRIINPNSMLAFMGLDRDGDTIRNECDNCPNDFNQEQLDFDEDLVGDVCDEQTCGNGEIEGEEQCDDGNRDNQDGCSSVCELTSTFVETAYLKASNAGVGDYFGKSVAISRNTLVVGADEEDPNDEVGGRGNSGAAYVYEKNEDGVWEETAYLKASNAGVGDAFGVRVSTSGIIVVVGAYLEDGGGQDSGAAYIYEKNEDGEWEETTYLKASNVGVGDHFGKAVSTFGNTAVVGAYLEDGRGQDSGAAYIYEKNENGVWEEAAYLKASNAGVDDAFGASISISGSTVVVGAHYEDGNADSGQDDNPINEEARNSGAVYVFERNEVGQWEEITYLKSFNAGSEDYFGRSSAISEGKIVIGAYREDGDVNSGRNGQPVNELAPAAGAVYVFER